VVRDVVLNAMVVVVSVVVVALDVVSDVVLNPMDVVVTVLVVALDVVVAGNSWFIISPKAELTSARAELRTLLKASVKAVAL